MSEQQQPQQQQERQNVPSLTEFLLPFSFVIRPQTQPTQPPSSQGTNDQPTSPAAIHFFVYPIYGTGGGEQTPPPFMFFTPFFVPQENRKHVSESTMKKLSIIEITQEDIDAQATCPICLDAFSLPSNKDACQKSDETSTENETSSVPQSIRQMPCKHMFCESCLFQWLKQNNTCPLCRKEIESEDTSQQNDVQTNAENTTASSPEDVTMDDASLSTSTESNSSFVRLSHTHSPSHHDHNHHHQQASISCALESVSCCGESQNNEESPTASPLITLPQCHHQFHASCLRTSLIVEGYSFESPNSRSLNFYCPTCRSPAIIQNDILKTLSANLSGNLSSPQEQPRQLSLPIVIPLPPDSDGMEVD